MQEKCSHEIEEGIADGAEGITPYCFFRRYVFTVFETIVE